MKKEYKTPEFDMEIFKVSSSVFTASGLAWEEDNDGYEE